MADYSFSSEVFFEELMRISTGIVWKDPTKVLENENLEALPDVEQYILARQGRLSYELVEAFDESVFQSLGFSEDDAARLSDFPDNLPEQYRDEALKRQMQFIIDNYEEQNNYYRMLNGLPDIEETEEDFIYVQNRYDVPGDIPIHELDSSYLYLLDGEGYIDKLIEKYPKKKYLQHLLEKKIDIYTARESADYSILWMEQSDYETLSLDFVEVYNECRYMIRNVFYQENLRKSNPEYSGFIGMMILFATIWQMHRLFLDADITRDFYDEDSLRLVYDSYGVPFYSSIPVEYHRRLIRRINTLIAHKGSTRVFYDLFDIFDLDDMSVFEFYMMKTHKFSEGKPIFVYNEDGTINQRATYDIIFGKVRLYNNPIEEMQDPKNQIPYEDMIRNDPYWINDKELIDSIYSEEFNYMESKYLGIQTTFNLMKIMYETVYYFKLILDNRNNLKQTTVYNSSIHQNVNLFDLVLYVCSLITSKYGYEGNIPVDLASIGAVMGFDFTQDLTVLKQNISKNDYLKYDNELLTYLETMDVRNINSVKRVYNNLSSLRYYLARKMAETDDPRVWTAYHELYDTIMYSQYTQATFTKRNGFTAESFSDMLKDCNLTFFNKYDNVKDDPNELDKEISDALYLLKSSCNTLKYLQYADSINVDDLIEHIFKLLEFFKTAKADLTGYEITYSLVNSIENNIKLMTWMQHISDEYGTIVTAFDSLDDLMWMIKDRMRLKKQCQYTLKDQSWRWNERINYKSLIDHLDDQIRRLSEIFYDFVDKINILDFLEDHKEIFLLPDEEFAHKDKVQLLWEEIREIIYYHVEDDLPIYDLILKCADKEPIPMKTKHEFLTKLYILHYIKIKSQYRTTDALDGGISISLGLEGKTNWDFTLNKTDDLTYPGSSPYHWKDDLINLVNEWKSSTYYLKDKEMPEEELVFLRTDVEAFLMTFRSSLDEYQNIRSDFRLMDFLRALPEILELGSSKVQFKDQITEYFFIYLNYMAEKNFIQYLVKGIDSFALYFLGNEALPTEEDLSINDLIVNLQEHNLFTFADYPVYADESYDHQSSKMSISDQIFERIISEEPQIDED